MDKRNTRQKSIILKTVRGMKNHPTAEQVCDEVHKSFPTVGRATVFRNLKSLSDDGMILRVEVPDAADRFDFNTAEHYHFVCRECGRVFDSAAVYRRELNREATADGFVCESHSITFHGLCPECSNLKEEDKNDVRKH